MGLLGTNKGISGWPINKSLSRFLGIHGAIRRLRIVWTGSCTTSLIPCESLGLVMTKLINRDEFGVSRLRVADGEALPEGSSAVALTPIGMFPISIP